MAKSMASEISGSDSPTVLPDSCVITLIRSPRALASSVAMLVSTSARSLPLNFAQAALCFWAVATTLSILAGSVTFGDSTLPGSFLSSSSAQSRFCGSDGSVSGSPKKCPGTVPDCNPLSVVRSWVRRGPANVSHRSRTAFRKCCS